MVYPSVHYHRRRVRGENYLHVRVEREYEFDEPLLPVDVQAHLRLVHEQIILTTHSPAVVMNGWMDKVTEVSDIVNDEDFS